MIILGTWLRQQYSWLVARKLGGSRAFLCLSTEGGLRDSGRDYQVLTEDLLAYTRDPRELTMTIVRLLRGPERAVMSDSMSPEASRLDSKSTVVQNCFTSFVVSSKVFVFLSIRKELIVFRFLYQTLLKFAIRTAPR